LAEKRAEKVRGFEKEKVEAREKAEEAVRKRNEAE